MQIQRIRKELYLRMMSDKKFNFTLYLEPVVKYLNSLKHSRMKLSADEITRKNEKFVFNKYKHFIVSIEFILIYI